MKVRVFIPTSSSASAVFIYTFLKSINIDLFTSTCEHLQPLTNNSECLFAAFEEVFQQLQRRFLTQKYTNIVRFTPRGVEPSPACSYSPKNGFNSTPRKHFLSSIQMREARFSAGAGSFVAAAAGDQLFVCKQRPPPATVRNSRRGTSLYFSIII